MGKLTLLLDWTVCKGPAPWIIFIFKFIWKLIMGTNYWASLVGEGNIVSCVPLKYIIKKFHESPISVHTGMTRLSSPERKTFQSFDRTASFASRKSYLCNTSVRSRMTRLSGLREDTGLYV
jgi:hypothetical protein